MTSQLVQRALIDHGPLAVSSPSRSRGDNPIINAIDAIALSYAGHVYRYHLNA
jgi:hypothetical protein